MQNITVFGLFVACSTPPHEPSQNEAKSSLWCILAAGFWAPAELKQNVSPNLKQNVSPNLRQNVSQNVSLFQKAEISKMLETSIKILTKKWYILWYILKFSGRADLTQPGQAIFCKTSRTFSIGPGPRDAKHYCFWTFRGLQYPPTWAFPEWG